MANLSITQAWNETAEFVRREAGLLFPIAFLLVALPGGIVQLFVPEPGGTSAEQVGRLLMLIPLGLVAGILGMIGTIALTYLALQPGASVGEALKVGGRRFLMLLAASLLIVLGLIASLIPLVAVFMALGVREGVTPTGATASAVFLIFLVYLIGLAALWVRLMLMTPVAAVENAGPIAIIRRSWNLTAGHFWKLLGFLLLFLLAALVVLIAFSAVVGIFLALLVGRPEPGTTAMIIFMLVTALFQSAFSLVLVTLVARIYAQLAGTKLPEVFV
jgi:hypothetical protein